MLNLWIMCYNIFLLNWNLGRQKADLAGGERPFQCLCPFHSFCMSVDEALDFFQRVAIIFRDPPNSVIIPTCQCSVGNETFCMWTGESCQLGAPDIRIWGQLLGGHATVWQHYSWMGPLSHQYQVRYQSSRFPLAAICITYHSHCGSW